MPVPFLSSITLNKNEVQDFKVFNYAGDVTPLTGTDIGYFWTNTTGGKTLRWWDGSAVRTILDSASTTIVAADLSGGAAGSLPYQLTAGDTTFLGIGTANQVLTVNTGATAPQWTSQSNLSVGTATFLAGGAQGSIPVQSAAGTTGFLTIGAAGRILTSDGTTPVWSATIPSSAVSGLSASATTDTTNAANISSGLLPLARLALANGQFYVGDASNNPAATAKTSIPLSGFGAATADVSMGTYKITNLGTPLSTDPDSTAATKGYVDSVAQGLDVKASCLVASTTDITLASPGSITIDGISSATFTSGVTRILVKDQSAQAENGIYIWNGTASAMTRSLDANTWDELVGAFTFIETGTANADSGWVCTANAGGTLGTTPVPFVKFSQAGSYTAGNGMVLSGGVFHFAQDTNYTAGRIPFASGNTTIGFSSNLFWDNSNSRLGIGTATPAYKLEVVGGDIAAGNGTIIGGITYSSRTEIGAFSNHNLGLMANNITRYLITTGGAHTWYGGSGGTSMTLDTSGNLGLGVTPSAKFDVGMASGSGTPRIRIDQTEDNPYLEAQRWTGSGSNYYGTRIVQSAGFYFQTSNQAAIGSQTFTTRMVLDASGRLSVGASVTALNAVQIQGAGQATTSVSDSGDGSALFLADTGSAGNNGGLLLFGASVINGHRPQVGIKSVLTDGAAYGTADMIFVTRTTTAATTLSEKMRLTKDGNLGLGVTPSAWSGKAIDIGTTGSVEAIGGNSTSISYNRYFNGSQNIYKTNGYAAIFAINSGGQHVWYTAPAGTAGNAISFSAVMTLDASGNLGVGVTPSGSYKLQVNGASYLAGVIHMDGNSAIRSLGNGGATYIDLGSGGADGSLVVRSSSAYNTRLTLDSSGNLGLGAVPVTAFSGYRTFDVGYGGQLYSGKNGYPSLCALSANSYVNASGSWQYKVTNEPASNYFQYGGQHEWYTAAASASSAITTFATPKMTLDASGNLGIGITPTSKLHISGTGTQTLTINTNTSGDPTISLIAAGQDGALIAFDRTNNYLRFDVSSITGAMRLNTSGNLLFKTNGTASAPTIANADNTDTGLYWPTDADTLALAVGGSDAIYIDSSRRVGIGTSDFTYYSTAIAAIKKDQAAITYLALDNQQNNSSAGSGLLVGAYGGEWKVYVPQSATFANPFIFSFGSTERLRIKSTGQLNFSGLASAPTGAVGDLYYNSTSNTLQYHNNSAFQQISRKYSTALAGTNTSFTVTHNFGTRDVTVQVRKSGSTYDLVYTDVQMTTTDTVTVIFASSVTGSDYTVTVIG